METTLLGDARAISSRWLTDLNLTSLIEERLNSATPLEGTVDVVAIGKASREMALTAQTVLGSRVARTIIVSEVGAKSDGSEDRVLIGEHPI
ncbi:MAG: DUF4147 domain-containing protein, partial [Acidimicrobiales bacterium]